MSFLNRLFANPAPPVVNHSQPASQMSLPGSAPNSLSPMAEQNASRRELLRLVLRDTLNRTGIPTSWVGADLLAANSRGRVPGIHVRLLLKHWDPRLMLHGIAFEQSFKKRVLTLDPQADRWLLGISWQFSLADARVCPPLPHPGVWTSSIPNAIAAHGAAEMDVTASDPADLLGGSIVISGPAATPESSAARPAAAAANRNGHAAAPDSRAGAKADLERLFAIRDEDIQRNGQSSPSARAFAATEPAGLVVLPPPSRTANDAPGQASFAKTDVFRRPELTRLQ